MRYLLTEKEFKMLVSSKKLKAAQEALAEMRLLLVGKKCVHSKTKAAPGERYCYCDQCPLSDIGGDHADIKRANRPTHEMSKLMCDLNREYSQ